MSIGFCAPCPDNGSEYVSRGEETRRFFAALQESNKAQEEALAARAAAAGRSVAAQSAHEWALAQAPLVEGAKAKAEREDALRMENQVKGLVVGGKFSHEEAIMWPQTGVPGVAFPTAGEALACAEKVLRTAMAWNADHRAKLDGLLFHGEAEKETYVLAYFASTRRLAICRA